MRGARLIIGLLGLVVLIGGVLFAGVSVHSGAHVVPTLGYLLAAYGAWLLVQAVRGPG